MEVILRQAVEKLGHPGDILFVATQKQFVRGITMSGLKG